MTIKFCSLASGSSGNCQYIETEKIRVLVDVGLSGKRVQELLSSIEIEASTIDCILITHEHKDHIKGAGILSRRFDIPIYANENTWNNMRAELGKIKEENIKVFKTNSDFEVGDLGIVPFKVFHDAVEPVGYSFYNKDKKISIVTDTGCIDHEIKNKIKNSNLLVIESNHDTEMLRLGSYPWFLKKRVAGEQGHLSNDDAGNLLKEVLMGNNEKVLLGHLSRENNFPELAYQTVSNILNESGINVSNDISLGVTFRDKATKVYKL
ncbi:metallo-beta-lactamase family protein [Gottschalkia acidurici 9a]|uniref:Metallo-beta-lactamase family protein n=1 Tax=Gottschalkia acidurici (strain ATCC 7906 / DSM 604 / BCRC 14475 / CIP 104303 / KCTC 5404 / NCIMB 10678 / 9a) TaxID=1128398 RepID=K0B5N0_GOTA9|nr:MBL fold metallo-hydrolase [Gottschalkia acidurici]AFS79821.1 metallo-beta-lactamase family protein [Gottschalkia acidurici 9a]